MEKYRGIYHGTECVKDTRIDTLMSQLQCFHSFKGKLVASMYSRLMKITNEAQGFDALGIDHVLMILTLDDKYGTICTPIKEKPEFNIMTRAQFLGRIEAHEIVLLEKEILRSPESGSRRHGNAPSRQIINV